MYDTYLPLLTYAHANGEEGSKVVPALAKSLPKISNGGKTYTLTLRKGLKYSDGTPVKASDFASSIERLFKLNSPGTRLLLRHRRRRKIRQNEERRHPRHQDRRQDRRDRHRPGQTARHLHQRARAALRRAAALRHAGQEPHRRPAPGTGPYAITKSEPGRGWSYERNPYWAKANGEADAGGARAATSTRSRSASSATTRPRSTNSNRARPTGCRPPVPADRYADVKDKYEGTQFRVEPPINIYYFWMNTTEPPFDDLKVRQAVNYAVDTDALERIYAGSLAATHQILPAGDARPRGVRPLPARHGQSQGPARRSQPVGPRHHRLDRQRKPQRRSRRLLRRTCSTNSASTPS